MNTALNFPWDSVRANRSHKFTVLPGDIVRVQIESLPKGSELDHQSDQGLVSVRYVVTRNSKAVHAEDEPVEYYRDSSFLLWVDFTTAVKRLKELAPDKAQELLPRIHDRTTDPTTYGQRYLDRAVELQDKQETGARLTYPDRR